MRHRKLFYLKQLFIMPFFLLILGLLPQPARALDDTATDYSDSYQPFSEAELAQMLAPIALYPDSLLAQVLMASTYPIEIIEADRWISRNRDLTGDTLDVALLEQDWDPSIKALCHFPSVLALMSERIGETTDIGNAFLAQEVEVTTMIQRLRAEAHAQGNLATTSQQTVVVQDKTILIVPANPAVIYVPYYDPYYVYGAWWYPAYPPYYWGPVGVDLGFRLAYWPEVHFGFSFGSWSYFDWHRHTIHIDVHRRPRFVRHDRWIVRSDRWQHAPHHRRGVSYRNPQTARKYGQAAAHFSRTRPEGQRFSGRTPQDRFSGRRGDGRPASGQAPTRVKNSWRDRRQHDQQRNVPARQVQSRSGGGLRDQPRLNRQRTVQKPVTNNHQIRERSERTPAQRANLNPPKQQRPVEPVRQVRQIPAHKQQEQARLKPARPAQSQVKNNRQGHKRSVGQIRKHANPTPVKRQRQSVEPTRKIRERQQVQMAERGSQQKTTTAVEQNRGSEQSPNRSGRGVGGHVSKNSGKSWRGSRGGGLGADDRQRRWRSR